MGTMSFDVPDGVTVQVLLGAQQPFALTDESPRTEEPPRRRHRGKLVGKTVFAVALLGVGFVLGQHVRSPGPAAGTAEAAAAVHVPAPVTKAFPELPPAAASAQVPAPASQQVPSAFADQLRQTPAVQPPPGRPPQPGGPGTNAFGLEN
jgi:hypothetical protein